MAGKRGDQVVFSVRFSSNWLRDWHEFSRSIAKQSEIKPNATPEYFQHSIENYSKGTQSNSCPTVARVSNFLIGLVDQY